MCAQGTELRIKLSDRMQVIADHIEPGETVADIGTDHGQIPVWLFAQGVCPRAILTDISEGSLAKAKETAAAYQFGSGLDFRAGDGLQVLAPGEADAVIIAGMGGKLIRQILADSPEHTFSFRKYILQPRKGAGPLRKWLLENGFRIVSEDIVREGRHLPEIITAISPGDPSCKSWTEHDLADHDRTELVRLPEEDVRLRVPPWMIHAHGPLSDYFAYRISQEELILTNLQRARTPEPELEKKILENIAYLEGLSREIQ